MLPPGFTNRFQQLMDISLGEVESQARAELSRRSAELAKRGHVSPQHLGGLCHENAEWLTRQRINAALEAMNKVFYSFHLSFTDDLPDELKALIPPYVSEGWCLQVVDQYSDVHDEQGAKLFSDLIQVRTEALASAHVEIDLWTDELKNRSDVVQLESKELEQKFGILFSAKQARVDFERWAKELEPLNRSLALIFLDIDNFKLLNTEFTEVVIDETILPAAMRLVKGFACLRGGAYRQGGEEFLIILANADESEATAFAEKLRAEFEATNFEVHGNVKRLTISIGVALWPDHGSDYGEVLKKANHAESEAKRLKNTWVVAKHHDQH